MITMSSDDDYASDSNEEESDDSKELETIAQIAACEKSVSKKRSKKVQQHSKNTKRVASKSNSSTTSSAVVRSLSVSYSADELLLVAKAFMKVSCDAKHSTDKKAEKFWEEVSLIFEELVATANKINESNPEYSPIESGRSVETIRIAGSANYSLQCRNLPASSIVAHLHLVKSVTMLSWISIMQGYAMSIMLIQRVMQKICRRLLTS